MSITFLHNRINYVIEREQLSNVDFARSLGVSAAYISQLILICVQDDIINPVEA
jgi:hypothetical protein